MKTFTVDVTIQVEVTLDETKFNEAFMEEFRQGFFPFYDLEDHAEHLAQLVAREMVEPGDDRLIEGYGQPSERGIVLERIDQTTEIVEISAEIPA